MYRPQAYFLTGTDTEVGKTFVACALLHAARRQGLRSLAMKPVAAGTDARGRNQDVEELIAASTVKAPRDLVNPVCLRSPVAPHLAAAEEGRTISLDTLTGAYRQLSALADFVVVEGVGGFVVPLGDAIDSAGLARCLDLPVILVVGLRLGCINHALLTVEAIHARGLGLAGWIANTLDPEMAWIQENVAALAARIDAPLLGVLPRLAEPDAADAADFLRLP